MGTVFLAEDTRLGRKVALKLLSPELADDERFEQRFLRESKLAAAIDHPNIVPVYQAGEEDGALFIAMRFVDGIDLRTLLREEEGGLDPERAASLLEQVGGALDAAHARGLVHRDVKPANILIARQGDGAEHCYLADFGLTKQTSSLSGLTVTGQFMGTLDYMAPEQIQGAQVDGRADIYSLGCVLHECLTGRPPFRRETDVAAMWAHVQDAPPSPSEERRGLPSAVDHVLSKALAKAPEERYGTCGDLTFALRVALGLEKPLREPRLRRATLSRPSRRIFVGGAVALVALITALVATMLVTHWSSSAGPRVAPNSAVQIDPVRMQVANAASIPSRLGRLTGAAAARAGVWVSTDTAKLLRIDSGRSKPLLRRTISGGIDSIAVTPSAVWTTAVGHRVVTRVGLPSGPVDRIPLIDDRGRRYDPQGVKADGKTVWVFATGGGSGGLAIGRIAEGERRLEFARARLPEGTHYAIRNGEIWALRDGAQGKEVAAFDPDDGFRKQSVASVPGGDQLVYDGRYVWVSIPSERSVVRIDPVYKGVPTPVPLRDLPAALAFGNGNLWVACEHGTVWRIDPRTLKKTSLKLGGYLNAITAGPTAVWAGVGKAPESLGPAPAPDAS